jgi:hypothetical protein
VVLRFALLTAAVARLLIQPEKLDRREAGIGLPSAAIGGKLIGCCLARNRARK